MRFQGLSESFLIRCILARLQYGCSKAKEMAKRHEVVLGAPWRGCLSVGVQEVVQRLVLTDRLHPASGKDRHRKLGLRESALSALRFLS
jgi:hypothetical protein